MTREERAKIARENGAKSKGPKTAEGKEHSKRNAIKHAARALALKILVPPHSACLANDDRQAFYDLFDQLVAKYRPADAAELALVREIADFQWKLTRNQQMENAFFNREMLRQAAKVKTNAPELQDLETSLATHEALTGNAAIAQLRKDTHHCLRAIALLQRRLIQMQRYYPPAAVIAPTTEKDRKEGDFLSEVLEDGTTLGDSIMEPERTGAGGERTGEEGRKTFDIQGPATEDVIELYTSIFHPKTLALIERELLADPKAA